MIVVAPTLCAFALSSSPTFAVGCSITTPLDASAGSASCDMGIAATVNPGVLTLANDANATVPASPFTLTGSALTVNFNFASIVRDHRGSTAGWALEAASTGLHNGTTTIPLTLTADTFGGGGSSCTNGTCTPTSFTSIGLTTTPARFLQAGNGTSIIVDGDYTNETYGYCTIPAGSPAGSYTGTITITLLSTF